MSARTASLELFAACAFGLAAGGLAHAAEPELAWSERTEVRGRCAAPDVPRSVRRLLAEPEHEPGWSEAPARGRGARLRPRVTVAVHVHVIRGGGGRWGDVSARVPAQIAVLDAAYERAGFDFVLASLELVDREDWFRAAEGSAAEVAMKAALRRGGPEALNLYTTQADRWFGWATYPWDVPAALAYDGVVVFWATLPGTGLRTPVDPRDEPDGVLTWDEGDTATHEVGHWLGLLHTFEGGCAHPGDEVVDTPAEAEPALYCVSRDTCAGRRWRGSDPVTNYMDYTDDACMQEFTPLQAVRMHRLWRTFRASPPLPDR